MNEAARHMAADAALLDEGRLAFRVYGWDAPAVTLGRFQDPARDLRPDCPIPWAERPTGGRAVLHGHDVTVGLVVPLHLMGDPAQLSRSVRRVYPDVVAPLTEALCASGLDVGSPTEKRATATGADCFAHLSPMDLADATTGEKLCGCALKLTPTAVLVQASIPNGPPRVDPAKVFWVPARLISPVWDACDFADALASALQARFGPVIIHP